MKNLDILIRQHEEMLTIIKAIETAAQTSQEDKAEEIAYNMNALSGKMKMHLLKEDQFLYPSD
jgi:Hemerythrin HHE cation binding domain.